MSASNVGTVNNQQSFICSNHLSMDLRVRKQSKHMITLQSNPPSCTQELLVTLCNHIAAELIRLCLADPSTNLDHRLASLIISPNAGLSCCNDCPVALGPKFALLHSDIRACSEFHLHSTPQFSSHCTAL